MEGVPHRLSVIAAAAAILGFGAACGTSSPGDDSATTGTNRAAPTASGSPNSPPPPGRRAGEKPALPRGYQPLWPFATADEVLDWQERYRSKGSQPWHLSAGDTAVGFSRDFLGFREVDGVKRHKVDGDHARVTVGYDKGEGGEAAVVHLVRFGAGEDAPWEVVGTDDASFSLTTPPYGSEVGTQIKVGGKITGVDESIRVAVVQKDGVIGESGCQPAGGEARPWSGTVTVRDNSKGPATIVASTGGHVAEVERFVVTGVRISP